MLFLSLASVSAENDTPQSNSRVPTLELGSNSSALSGKPSSYSQEEANLQMTVILSSIFGSLFLMALAYQGLNCWLSSSKRNHYYIDQHQNLEKNLPDFFKNAFCLLNQCSRGYDETSSNVLRLSQDFDEKFQTHLKSFISDIQTLYPKCDSLADSETLLDSAFSHAESIYRFAFERSGLSAEAVPTIPQTIPQNFFQDFLKETAKYPESIKRMAPTCLFLEKQSALTDMSKQKNDFVKSFLKDIVVFIYFLRNQHFLKLQYQGFSRGRSTHPTYLSQQQYRDMTSYLLYGTSHEDISYSNTTPFFKAFAKLIETIESSFNTYLHSQSRSFLLDVELDFDKYFKHLLKTSPFFLTPVFLPVPDVIETVDSLQDIVVISRANSPVNL